MTDFLIERTGQLALQFDGAVIAEESSHIAVNGGPLQNRWHELTLYQTRGDQLVLAVAYRSRWQGEHDHHSAEVTSRAGAITALTKHYDPLAWYGGYPEGAHYAEKDRRQREAIRLGYERAVSRLMHAAHFAEPVE